MKKTGFKAANNYASGNDDDDDATSETVTSNICSKVSAKIY